jgi:hypothetical protein
MKLKSDLSKFFTNKLVLNIVSFIALFNVIGYMVIGKYNIVLYFIVIAILVRYFSKNMIIVLGIPLIIINLIALKGSNNYVEGFDKHDNNNNNNNKNQNKNNNNNQNNNNKNNSNRNEIKNKVNNFRKENDHDEHDEQHEEPRNPEKFEVGQPKKGKYSVDYATTIEEAYGQLNSLLGEKGVQSLTEDTHRLIEQQKQLTGSLKDMGPLIKQMGPMVQQVQEMMKGMGNKDGINGIINQMTNIGNTNNK